MGYNRWVYPEGSSAVVCYNYNPTTKTLYVVYQGSKEWAYVYGSFTHLAAARLISADSCGETLAELVSRNEKRCGKATKLALTDLPSIPVIK